MRFGETPFQSSNITKKYYTIDSVAPLTERLLIWYINDSVTFLAHLQQQCTTTISEQKIGCRRKK